MKYKMLYLSTMTRTFENKFLIPAGNLLLSYVSLSKKLLILTKIILSSYCKIYMNLIIKGKAQNLLI